MKLKLRRELSIIYTGGKRIVVYDNGDVEEENLGEEKPAEPLIKDEKTRFRLRDYARVMGWKSARYSTVYNAFVNQGDMFFTNPSWELDQLENRDYIPIAELCGEEEE